MSDATDNRTTELLPCPFCGGEAELKHKPISGSEDRGWFVRCRCSARIGLKVNGIGLRKAEAVAAWNARAERTCRNENGNDKYANFICSECGLHMHKPVFGRSYVDEDGKRWYGTSSEHGLHYCPNCGAKVIG